MKELAQRVDNVKIYLHRSHEFHFAYNVAAALENIEELLRDH